jgi:hypothetical protein
MPGKPSVPGNARKAYINYIIDIDETGIITHLPIFLYLNDMVVVLNIQQ